MKPSTKSPAMEAAHKQLFGFDRKSSIRANRCAPPPIGCGGIATEFRDALSEREFSISGLCQKCQDEVFDAPDEEKAAPPRPARYEAKPDEYVTGDYQMFSGQAEAASHKYRKYIGKSGRTWLVADSENAAENVYVTNNVANTTSRGQGFEGFGGATLRFECVDGSVFEAHGPWHSSADGLFADTGVDVRECHRTFVVLSREMEGLNDGTWRRVFRDIVYRDQGPTLGRYDRYKDLIKQHPEAKYYYMTSKGGGSSGTISTSDRK